MFVCNTFRTMTMENCKKLFKLLMAFQFSFMVFLLILFFFSPTVVSMCGFECSYDNFKLSLQPTGFVHQDLMTVYIQFFNNDHKNNSERPYSCKKVAFTPCLVVSF